MYFYRNERYKKNQFISLILCSQIYRNVLIHIHAHRMQFARMYQDPLHVHVNQDSLEEQITSVRVSVIISLSVVNLNSALKALTFLDFIDNIVDLFMQCRTSARQCTVVLECKYVSGEIIFLSVSFADINECDNDVCGANSVCTDTEGSFKCSCKPGFKSQPDGSCNGRSLGFIVLYVGYTLSCSKCIISATKLSAKKIFTGIVNNMLVTAINFHRKINFKLCSKYAMELYYRYDRIESFFVCVYICLRIDHFECLLSI